MLEVERLTITAATHRMGLASLKAVRRWVSEYGITVYPREMGRVQRQQHGIGSAYPSQSKLYREFDTEAKISARFTPAVLASFWKNVDTSGKCWVWTGWKTAKGYGRIIIHDKPTKTNLGLRVHRASWLIHRGVIPGDMHVCHHCDNRACVNPEHLYLATNAQNHRDKARRERVAGPYGRITLNAELVRKIRASSRSDREWAKELGVHPSTIRSARDGKHWKHVN